MKDLTLNLPSGLRLTTLDVVAEFADYNELLQRVVSLILLSDLPELSLDGVTLPELLRVSNKTDIMLLNSRLNFIASAALGLLNSEDVVATDQSIVADIVGGSTQITITVTPTDGVVVAGEYVIE